MVPNCAGLQNSAIAKSSCRSFCSGVPVSTMRRFVSTQVVSSFHVCVDVFFKRWPSSQINRSKLTDCLKEKGCQNYGKRKISPPESQRSAEVSVWAVYKTNKWYNALLFRWVLASLIEIIYASSHHIEILYASSSHSSLS